MSDQPQRPRIDFAEQLRKNWVIIAFIASLVVGWTNVQAKINNNEKEITDLKMQVVASNVRVDNYQTQLADVSGDIKAIKESLSFIKDKIK